MSEENELPEGWVKAKLRDVVYPGTTRNPQMDDEGEFFYVDIDALDNSKQKITSPKRLSNAYAPGRARMVIRFGDIIFSLVRPYLKNIALVPQDLDNQIASTAYCVMRPEGGLISEFIFYSLLRKSFIDSIRTYGDYPPTAHDDEFLGKNIAVAPTNEQQRIVESIEEQFSLLDDSVNSLQKDLIRLKRARESVLKFAVEGKITEEWREENPVTETGSELLARILVERRSRWEAEELEKMRAKGIVPKDEKWKEKYKEPIAPDTKNLSELPESWCWASVKQLSSSDKYSLAIGPFGSNLKVQDYRDRGVPLVFVRNIRSGIFNGPSTRYISEAKANELHAHQVVSGDILITKMGDPPGDACLYPEGRAPAIITADCIKWTLSPLLPEHRFFVHAINSSPVKQRILNITRGVAQLKVSLSRFEGISIPLPPFEEQEQIVNEVEMQISIIAHAEASIEANLKRIEVARQLILAQAFVGELVEQDPDDEPASVLLERIRAERKKREQEEQQRRKEERMNGANKGRAKRTPKKGRQPLQQVLIEAGQPLAPDDLFREAGLKSDVIEDVDAFYEELREEVKNKRIRVDYPDDTKVLLSVPNVRIYVF